MSASETPSWTGLWLYPTQLSGGGRADFDIARVIVDGVYFLALLWALWFSPLQTRDSKTSNVNSRFRYGTHCLTLWYLLHVLDVSFQAAKLPTTYAYLISDPFFTAFRFAADILFLSGTHRLVWSRSDDRLGYPLALSWRLGIDFTVLALTTFALFNLALRLANVVFWLQVADFGDIQDLATKKNALETLFSILQWLVSCTLVIVTAISRDLQWTGLTDPMNLVRASHHLSVTESLVRMSLWLTKIFQAPCLLLAISLSLWCRCLAEMVYICHFYSDISYMPLDAPLARDTVYGLLSMILLALLMVWKKKSLEENSSRLVLARVRNECQQHVLRKLNEMTREETPVEPLRALLVRMKQNRIAVLSQGTNTAYQNFMNSRGAANQLDPYKDTIEKYEAKYGHIGAGSAL